MSRLSTIDLQFVSGPEVIAAALVDGPGGCVLVDPGPASTIPALEAGLAAHGRRLGDVDALLITHIHLDHSGGAGVLLRENPRMQVYVHGRGARHLVDPTRLVDSASRLYGDDMPRYWGDVLPVPSGSVHALSGGERLVAGGEAFDVQATPGHASHHVCYFHERSGTAFVGDTGGIRIPGPLFVAPPTPPPDIDIEAWQASLDLVAQWKPARLFLTHFGAFDDVDAHLAELRRRLWEWAGLARDLLRDGSSTDGGRVAAFTEAVTRMLTTAVDGDEAAVRRVRRAVPLDHCWAGLERYWSRPRG